MLKIPMSAAEFFIDGRCAPFLNKYKCCVSIERRMPNGDIVTVPQAPMMDELKHAAVAYGERLKLTVICRWTHVIHTSASSQPWSYHFQSANGVILYHAYKNQLPTSSDRRGPTIDLQLIQQGKERKGFYIYLSGGNPVSIGLYGPTGSKHTVGDDAELERNQRSKSARNQAMMQINETGKRLNIYVSGKL